jgi:hypothetical protein
MSRSYRVLLLVVLAGAIAVSAIARLPRAGRGAPRARAIAPVTDLAITVIGDRLSPEAASVPKGYRVRLTVVNAGRAPLALRLAGYEDRVAIAALAPGAAWRDTFLADRPGEGFAWLVNGSPAGRLAVTGSHLEEGHR